MKKAKILLTAIVIIATVGGEVAFKAKSALSIYYKTTADGICINQILVDHTVPSLEQFDASIKDASITANPPSSCTATYYYIND